MATIKSGANAPKTVSSVQAKAYAVAELATILDNYDRVSDIASKIAGIVGENDPVECSKVAVERALAGLGYTPDAWSPVITPRDRSGGK